MTIFNKSIELISAVEHSLLEKSRKLNLVSFLTKIISFSKREILFPFSLMYKGFDIAMRDIIKFTIVYVLGTVLMLYVFNYDIFMGTSMIKNSSQMIIPTSIFFTAIFITFFSIPSTISKYGVSNNHIESVVMEIKKLIERKEEVQYIKNNLESFQVKFRGRVNCFRTTIALFWAFNTFMFIKLIDRVLENKDNISESSSFMIIYIVLIFFFIMTELYNKGGLFIFKSIEFAFNEVSYTFEVENSKNDTDLSK